MATINKIHVGSSDYDLKAKELTADATGTTQAAGDNSTKIATTAFVQQELPQGSLDVNFNGTATGTTQALTNIVVGDTTYTVGGGTITVADISDFDTAIQTINGTSIKCSSITITSIDQLVVGQTYHWKNTSIIATPTMSGMPATYLRMSNISNIVTSSTTSTLQYGYPSEYRIGWVAQNSTTYGQGVELLQANTQTYYPKFVGEFDFVYVGYSNSNNVIQTLLAGATITSNQTNFSLATTGQLEVGLAAKLNATSPVANTNFLLGTIDQSYSMGTNNSVAIGTYLRSSGAASLARGAQTTATGDYSTAIGQVATGSGKYATALGYYCTANHRSQVVFGEYARSDTSTAASTARGNYIEIVGNGASTSNPSNARTLDWSGNETIAGNFKAAGLTDGTTTKTMTEILAGGGGSTNLYMHKVSVKLEPMMDPSSLGQDHIAYFNILGTDSNTGTEVGVFSIINKSSASIGDKLIAGTLGLHDFFKLVAEQGALVYIGLADSSTHFYLHLNCVIYDDVSQAISFGGWDLESGSYLDPGQYYFYASDIGTLSWSVGELETIALSITE